MAIRFSGISIDNVSLELFDGRQTVAISASFMNFYCDNKDEKIKVHIGTRRADGTGRINYWLVSTTPINAVLSNVTWVFKANNLYLDYLFHGEPVSFYLSSESNGVFIVSQSYTTTFPANFVLPYDNYTISERPTMLSQDVYYNDRYVGSAGCCVQCAVVSAKEIQEIRSGRGVIQSSIGWLFGATGENNDFSYYDTVFNFVKNYGIRTYSNSSSPSYMQRYPDIFLYHDILGFPGAKSFYLDNQDLSSAAPQKILDWNQLCDFTQYNNRYIPNLQTVIDSIQKTSGNASSVVLMDYGIDSSFDDSSLSHDGMVRDSSGDYRCGHAMVVLGWKTINKRHYWVCQNSWGSGRGDDGIFYIPFTNANAYDINNGYSCGIIGFYELIDDPNAPLSSNSSITPWSWESSNGIASSEETKRARDILYGIRPVSDGFSYKVWNDLIDKIKQIRIAKGLGAWDDAYGTYLSAEECKVKSGDFLSASKYNAMRYNVGSIRSTGIGDVSANIEELTGYHLIRVTDKINEVIGGMLQ